MTSGFPQPQKSQKGFIFTWIFRLALMVGSVFLIQCSFNKPADETPPPTNKRVHKSFFLNSGTPGKFSLQGATPKTFACGWAPVNESGQWSFVYLHNYNYASHCNIQFKIYENKLSGRLVNPSLPNNPEEWEEIVEIPITSHYYYESRKDSYARDTTTKIENTGRSNWESRDYMNIDLKNVRIKKWGFNIFWCGASPSGVDDIEWDVDKNFLGFTVSASDSCLGSDASGRFRFNFLAFDHDTNFQPTPYDDANSRHLNALHIIGKRPDGVTLQKYAAKWDIGTPGSPKKTEIILNQFPAEHVQIGKDVLKLWNDKFEKIAGVRPFVPVVKNLKYSFDLRYPAITWVNSRRKSANAPLGVGMVSADVTNGKILWGGVTVWAGMIDRYLNHFSSAESSSNPELRPLQFSLLHDSGLIPKQVKENLYESLEKEDLFPIFDYNSYFNGLKAAFSRDESAYKQIAAEIEKADASQIDDILKRFKNTNAEDYAKYIIRDFIQSGSVSGSLGAEDRKQYIVEVFRSYNFPTEMEDFNVDNVVDQIVRLAKKKFDFQESVLGARDELFSAEYYQRFVKGPTLEQSVADLKSSPLMLKMNPKTDLANLNGEGLNNEIEAALKEKFSTNSLFDMDRTFNDVAYAWQSAIAKKNIPFPQAFRAVMKDLLLHEVGHMIGLGHNFKENIIPPKGTVPEKIRQGLESYNSDEKGFIQMTTVMGYRHGKTEAIAPYDYLQPGPHDELVLTYLYARKYPVFKHGDLQAEWFEFRDLPVNGQIPKFVPPEDRIPGQFYASYFPACNDFFASMAYDPYCNRWDRGGDPVTLVKNYIQDLKDNLISDLYSFTDSVKQGDYRYREYRLWVRALRNLGRSRLFYDYMRQKYDKKVIIPTLAKGADGERNLLEFSKACREEQDHPSLPTEKSGTTGASEQETYDAQVEKAKTNLTLRTAFQTNPELKQLCVATGILMKELRSLLELPGKDYTIVDYNNYHRTSGMTGGDLNWREFNTGQDIGAWNELGKWPLKNAATKVLTSPYPFMLYRWWVLPVRRYAREDGGYLLNTLYPYEYNEAVRGAVANNMNFSDPESGESTTVGRVILNLGWSLWSNFYGNDIVKFPGMSEYFEMIRRQTLYRFKFAAVIVEKIPRKNDKDRSRRLKAKLYNFHTREWEPISEAYLTDKYKIVATPPEQVLLYPVSPFKLFSANSGYYLAYRLDFERHHNDTLQGSSVKARLVEQYNDVLYQCINGNGNGLKFFFDNSNSDEFQGFYWPDAAYKGGRPEKRHLESVDQEFTAYWNSKKYPGARPETCREALNGLGLIVNTAAILNGYWLNLHDFYEKGARW